LLIVYNIYTHSARASYSTDGGYNEGVFLL